jgi:hypothetical protein
MTCTKLDTYTTPTGARSHILYFISGQMLHTEDNNCNANLFFAIMYLCIFYKKNIFILTMSFQSRNMLHLMI